MADFSGMQPGIVALAKHMFAVFPDLELESGYRPGEGSYHGWGQAADIAASYDRFGVDRANSIMWTAAKYVNDSGIWRQLVEGIHLPNLSVKNHERVDSSFWGWDTWQAHANHLHLAVVGGFTPPVPPPQPQPAEVPDVPTMVVLYG